MNVLPGIKQKLTEVELIHLISLICNAILIIRQNDVISIRISRGNKIKSFIPK